jgi:hypothetical protein
MSDFPSENLNNQRICDSYSKLLQIYNSDIILDGTGSQVDLVNVTSSWALNSLTSSIFISSSFASSSISSSYSLTSSWSNYSVTASYSLNSVSASYSLTSSWSNYSVTASYSLNSVSASYVVSTNIQYPVRRVTGSYDVNNINDYTLLCDATSGSFNLKLPNPVGNTNIYNIKKIDNTGYFIHVISSNGSNIDFDVTQSIENRGTNMVVQSDGSQYWIL